MRPNNKTVEKNVKQGDLLPCREIILGKAYKQRGRMNVNGEDFDYFMERIPGTEAPMEILTIDMTVIEVEGALFEVFLKHKDGTWDQIEGGMLPIDIDLYDVDGPQFMV